MKWLSLLVLAGFIVGALAANFGHFLAYVQLVLLVVFVHNLLALVTGYGLVGGAGAAASATAGPSPSRWASRTPAWA